MLALTVGPWEVVILLVILVLLFGTGRFIAAGKALGRSAKDFKREVTREEPEPPRELPPPRDHDGAKRT